MKTRPEAKAAEIGSGRNVEMTKPAAVGANPALHCQAGVIFICQSKRKASATMLNKIGGT